MRFFCDAMLGGLARWLRAAGYDSLLAEGAPDRDILERCARDDRVLLTRDRELGLAARDRVAVLFLSGRDLDGQARQLRDVLGVDWQHAPFTRCLVDNSELAAAAPHHAERVPPSSRSRANPLRICPSCLRLYWPGGHVRRMQRRLLSWQTRAGAEEA